jgi:lysyl-tRNA synthetase class 2
MAKQKLEEIKKLRLQKVEKLAKMGIDPYPSKPKRAKIQVADALKKMGRQVSVAGRLLGLREHGNVVFADLCDETGKVQLFFQKKNLKDDFKVLKLLDIGDFVWVKGKLIKTTVGEVTVDIADFQLLTKSVRPLPSAWFGLKDVEDRYRKRYLDLLFSPEVRERFNKRTTIVREVRKYLDNLGFWEVETPTLQPLYGGANAKPFKTHHNALDCDFYLRIADELYLKRLLVGGYEKVYEICKDFRNEGIDASHSPEFTMIEYYEAYADYHRVMDVTEGLFKHLAKAIFGKMEIGVGGNSIDISKKWPRIEMTKLIKEKLGLDVEKSDKEALIKYCKENNIELVGGETKGQLVYIIFEHKITELLIQPTWVIDYPKDVSPLCKGHPAKKDYVERFEGYVGGK